MSGTHVQVDIRAALGTGFAATTRKASQHLQVFKGAAAQISAQQKVLSARIADTNRQMNGMRSQAFGMAAVGYGAAKAIAPAVWFEQAMVDVLAISTEAGKPLKKTSKAFAELTNVAKTLGASTEHSATQVAQGMKFMTMAGFNAQETIAGIGSVMALSTVGDLGADRASDIASNILGAFKMPADQMHQVADVMSQVITTANVDVEMLGETMKYMGPIAHKFGLSLSEAAASAGLLGNIGIQGSMAGTAMRQLMTRMAAPPKEARKALDALSISTKDAQGNMRAFQEIMGDVAGATTHLGSAAQLETFKKIFGQIAMTGGAELVSLANSGELQAYFDEVANNFEGAAKRIQATKLDTAQGDFTLLTSAISGAAVAIGDTLLPTLRSATQVLTTMFTGIAHLATAYPGLTQAILMTVAGLALFRTALLAGRVASLVFGTGLLRSRIALLAFSKAGIIGKAAVLGFASVTKTALLGVATGFRVMSAALLANPVGLAIAGIAYGASLIIRNWSAVSAFFQNLWASVKQTFVGAGQTVKALLSGDLVGAVAGLKTTWEGLSGYFQLLWQGVVGIFQAVIGDITGVLGAFVPDGIKNAWSGLKTFFADIWKGMVPKLDLLPEVPVLSNIATAITTKLGTGIIQPLKTAWTNLKTWFAGLWPTLFAGINLSTLKGKIAEQVKGLIPKIEFPKITWPEFKFPDLKFPELKLPELKFPEFKLPELKLPELKLPAVAVGALDNLGTKAVERLNQAWAGFSLTKLIGLDTLDLSLPKFDIAGTLTGGITDIKTKLSALKTWLGLSISGLFTGIKLPSLDLGTLAQTALKTFTSPFAGIGNTIKSWFPESLFASWISGNQKSAAALSEHTSKLTAFSGSAEAAVAKLRQLGAVERNKISFDAKNQLVDADAALAQSYQDLKNTAYRGWGTDNAQALSWIKDLEAGKTSVAQFQSALESQANSSKAWLAENATKLYEQAFALEEAKKNAEALKATLDNVAAANQKAVAAKTAVTNVSHTSPAGGAGTNSGVKNIQSVQPAISAAEAEQVLAKISAVNAAAAALPQSVQTALSAATALLTSLDWGGEGTRLMTSLASGLSLGALPLQTAVTAHLATVGASLAVITWFAHGAKLMETLIAGIQSKSAALKGAVSEAFAQTRKLMPSSDAKEGPFSSLTSSGQALLTTFAGGIRKAGSNTLKTPLRKVMQQGGQELTKPFRGKFDLEPRPSRPLRITREGLVQKQESTTSEHYERTEVSRRSSVTAQDGSSSGFGRVTNGQGGIQISMTPTITINTGGGNGMDGQSSDATLIAEKVKEVMEQLVGEAAFDMRSAFSDGF